MLSLRLQPERDGKEYMGKISHETAGIGSQRQDRKPGMRIWRNSDGYQCGRCGETEKAASLRKQRVGGTAFGSGFQAEMQGLRPSDHDSAQIVGKKREGNSISGKKEVKYT